MVCGLLAAVWLAAGCGTPAGPSKDAGAAAPQAAKGPAGDGLTAGPAAPKPAADTTNPDTPTSDLLRIGDTVIVTFLDLPEPPKTMELTIKEDGTITLPLLGHQVKAAGLTTSQLEEAIKKSYVPDYYTHMTVVVRPAAQYYSVKGEVKSPNRYVYASATTVVKAITAAGDFSEFARKRAVKVFRASGGKIETEDCIKALKDPRLDLPIYPGDLIVVPRRTNPLQR
jgi:polysaccharide export outer membrane protein